MLDTRKDNMRNLFLFSYASVQVCKIPHSTREPLFHRYNRFKSFSKHEVNQGVIEDRICVLSAQLFSKDKTVFPPLLCILVS